MLLYKEYNNNISNKVASSEQLINGNIYAKHLVYFNKHTKYIVFIDCSYKKKDSYKSPPLGYREVHH